MRQIILKIIILGTFTIIAACKTDGGGGSDNKVATVPGPQGVVQAYSNPNVYCQFGGGAFTCYQKNSINGLEICHTETKTYHDIPSLCQQVGFMQQQSQIQAQCNVSVALNRIYSEYCQGLPQPAGQPNYPGIPQPTNQLQPGFETQKLITCELTAYNGRHVIPKTQMQITLDGNQKQEFNFNKHYFCMDYRRFGMTKMTFTPGSKSNRTADTITLKNEGLDSEVVVSQTGFAGQEVKLEAQDNSGRVRLELTCTGQSRFKKFSPAAKYTQFICKGRSNLVSANGVKEIIDVVLPYDSSLLNSDIQLASGLTARITGDHDSGDSARIEYSADGLGLDYSARSSAYLKTVSTLKARNGHRKIDVTCSPK